MSHIKIFYADHLHTECTHENGAVITTDAPKDNGGKGESFSPTDLIGTALGSCMLTLMGLAAKKLGIEFKEASALVEKVMAFDAPRRIGKLLIQIRVKMDLELTQRTQLEQAALTCPVHASLHPSIEQNVHFVWGSE